jgi:hypothetical protein
VREEHREADEEEQVARDGVEEVHGGAAAGSRGSYSIVTGFVKIHGSPSQVPSTR